jgi:hypothetical protein
MSFAVVGLTESALEALGLGDGHLDADHGGAG